jgi:hypothetical protein
MSERSDEIALNVMAEDSGTLEGYLIDYKKGMVEIDLVLAHVGVLLEQAAGIALDDANE